MRGLNFRQGCAIVPSRTMASNPKPSAKNETGEYATFESALRKVLSVPHSEIKAKIDAGKQARKRQKQKLSSDRASRAAD